MLNVLGKYDELSPGMGYPSMKLSMEKNEYSGKKAIINYLKNGNVHMASASLIKDVFTGENAGGYKLFMDDGIYSWCSSLIYYVDKYNLRLPEDFETHVLKNS